MTVMAQAKVEEHESCGGRLVAVDGRTLPLLGAQLHADARGGVATVVLEQRFRNPYPEPLRVTYLMPLPADGAVSGYAFRIGDKRITGEVDRRHAARERFEEALAEGRSAALVEQERSSLFTQEIGNIPPGVEVVAELTIDQRLSWMDGEQQWEWRFPTAAAPRYMGEPGRVPDAAKINIAVADQPLPARASFEMRIRDRIVAGRNPESPSHALAANSGNETVVRIASDSGAALDRDIVVRWPVAQPRVGLGIDLARPSLAQKSGSFGFGLLTIVPPAHDAPRTAVARDLILLLDTSGSMSGAPLDQARRIAGALVDTLGDKDRLEMIEFSNSPRRWKSEPVAATAKARADAHQWLGKLRASGGTEMRTGILEALRPLRDESQRQIILVTDGQIGAETEVVNAIAHQLPKSSRVHTVGVGSGVNRSLTGPAARAGRGVEAVIGLGEDPERAARRLVARTNAPLVVDVEIEGSALVEHAPKRPGDLFAGAPSLVGLRLKPEGGSIVVRGRTATGTMEERIEIPPMSAASGSRAVAALFGREAVEDLEIESSTGNGDASAIDHQIEELGLEFQIATRMTSWVAVGDEQAVDPQAPTRREEIPQQLPYGMSIEGLGLRGVGGAVGGIYPASVHAGPAGIVSPAPMQAQEASKTLAFDDVSAPTMYAPRKESLIDKAVSGVKAILGSGGGGASHDAKSGMAPPRPMVPSPPKQPAEKPAQEEEKKREAKPELGRAKGKRADEPSQLFSKKTLAGTLPPSMRGKIVLRKKRQLVIEVTIDRPIDWEIPALALLALDGGIFEILVDAAKSTRAGALTPGQTLRITCTVPEPAESGEIETLTLHLPLSGPLVVQVG
jgi:Ca-activated chloride channel family protein